MTTAVLFLARGEGNGLAAAEAFFESYRAHPAGRAHELVVIVKGWDGAAGREIVEARARGLGATVLEVPDDGLDWGAYMRVAPRLGHDWLCFLNTHSRICADGWLAALRTAAGQPGVGAAGATGSWGTNTPVFRFLAPTVADYWRRKGAVKALTAALRLYVLRYPWHSLREAFRKGGRFPGFPNPHLRSNGFLVRRALFTAFIEHQPIPAGKRDALMLECGDAGFTRFLAAQGLRAVVAGADGRAYEAEHWPESRTHCVPDRSNLLVSDNRTRAYEAAAPFSRRDMERAVWGRTFTPWRAGP